MVSMLAQLGRRLGNLAQITVNTGLYALFFLVGLFNLKPLVRRCRTDRVTVAFQSYAVHLAQFYEPLIRALERRKGEYEITFQILNHPHFSPKTGSELRKYAHQVLRLPKERIKPVWQTFWEPFDLVVCSDVFSCLPPRASRSCLLLHGPGLTARVFTRSLLRKTLADFSQILVSGSYDERLVKEWKRPPLTKSRVYDAGFPFLDRLREGTLDRAGYSKKLHLDASKRTMLISPSWRGLTLTAENGATYVGDIVAALQGLDCNILVKPHACSLNPILARGVDWDRRLNGLSSEGLIRLDMDPDDRPALEYADVLITDISSRAFVFMLLGKPVIQYFPGQPPQDELELKRLRLLREGSFVVSSLQEIPRLLEAIIAGRKRKPRAAEVAALCFSHFGSSTHYVVRLLEEWFEGRSDRRKRASGRFASLKSH